MRPWPTFKLGCVHASLAHRRAKPRAADLAGLHCELLSCAGLARLSHCLSSHLRLYLVSNGPGVMTELLSAARLLGLGTPAHPLVSELDYLDLVDHGLPVRSLERIAAVVAPTDTSFRYRIVPKASLARRKAGKRLSAAQSVVVARLASVWAQAVRIWKSEGAARDFLYRKHPLLGARRPIDLVLENEIGAELVRGVLGRLEHGSAA
jgi:putative toxin-antitoxin system antitoxin component (TIGR02293 family)